MWKWYIFQGIVGGAVYISNFRWHWTPNGYVVAIACGIAAYSATALATFLLSLPSKISTFVQRCRVLALRDDTQSGQQTLSRIDRQLGDALEQRSRLRISDNSRQ